MKELLDGAAERPGENDPAGMVSFGRTLLAAQMFVLSEQARMQLEQEEKEQGQA